MSPGVKSALTTVLEDIALLPDRLSAIKTPFVLWRKPQSETGYLLIHLSDEKVLTDIHDLDELNEAFIINSFKDSHPPIPLILNGDIVIRFNQVKTDVKISPTLSGERLEKFIDDLGNETRKAKSKKSTDHQSLTDYNGMVRQALQEIEHGSIQKVVLARQKQLALVEQPNLFELHQKLSVKYPNAFVYALYTQANGHWIGATPEKLISVMDRIWFSTDSLAGTQPLASDQSLSDVPWTMKEIEEQAMVSRYIIECFKKIRLREYEEIGPKTVKAGIMAHLKTEFKVDMEATNSPTLPAIMLDLLHPTSAVCGFPRDKALQFINEHEGFDRELYSGFLGPVNMDGETNLFVNLRCMKLQGTVATLYAGAGITSGSDPEKEFQETELKMDTLLSVLEK